MTEQILSQLAGTCPWANSLHWFDTIDSTSTRAKAMAADGAPHGTVLLAGHQTGGRGRTGRSFSSPAGMGVYLSVILRPNCSPAQLMHLTCAVGVAMCEAIKQTCGLEPGIKWVNDLIYDKRKLGGILTELSLSGKTGLVDYAVVGIGINCRQKAEDFPEELRHLAISLETAAQAQVDPAAVAAAMIRQLYEMDKKLLTHKAQFMEQYRQRCVTLGQIVQVTGQEIRGQAVALTEEGALVIRTEEGSLVQVNSGEVSIRGMKGYL